MIYTNQTERKKGNTKNKEKNREFAFQALSFAFIYDQPNFIFRSILFDHVSMANIVEFPVSHCVANGACLLMNPIHANPFLYALKALVSIGFIRNSMKYPSLRFIFLLFSLRYFSMEYV